MIAESSSAAATSATKFNPFTASVCKISRLKEAQMCLTWYIFWCYNMSTFNAVHLIENARANKQTKTKNKKEGGKRRRKKLNLFKFHFFGGLFSGTLCHGSEGVNRTSHKMYLLNMQSPKHTEGWKEHWKREREKGGNYTCMHIYPPPPPQHTHTHLQSYSGL